MRILSYLKESHVLHMAIFVPLSQDLHGPIYTGALSLSIQGALILQATPLTIGVREYA